MAMKRFLPGLCLLLWTLAAVAGEARQPLLWRIEGGAAPQYLFGTIHLPDPRVTTLTPESRKAFESAEVIVTEIELSATMLMAMANASFLPRGETLQQKLPAPMQQQLNEELRAIAPQWQLAQFDRLKIWVMATNLPLLPYQLKYPGAPSLDIQLVQDGAQQGKPNVGIETLNEQLDIFDRLSEAEQQALLQDAISHRKKARSGGPDLLEQMVLAYVAGDGEKILALTGEEMASDPALGERLKRQLLSERNGRMAERIDARLRQHGERRHFIALGSAHLVGDGSVVSALERKGYRITRIRE
jgi:uncharacterized protein YbaP (TraB family)